MADRTKLALAGVGVLLALALIVFYRDLATLFSATPEADRAALPDSFFGNRASYGFALFSLFAVSSIAIRRIMILCSEMRGQTWRELNTEIGLYRMAHATLCLAFLMGAGPDVVLLLLYGEAAPHTMEMLNFVNRTLDAVLLVPFVAASTLFVRASQFRDPSMLPAKAYATTLFALNTRGDQMRDHLRIVLAIAVIAAGLALFK